MGREGYVSGTPLTAADLAGIVGPQSVRLIAPEIRGRIATGSEFYDALDGLPDDAGTLLLVPAGSRSDADEIAGIVEHAAELEYAGVALKCRDADVETLAAIARTHGMPLIRVMDRVGWRLLDALISQHLGEHQRGQDSHRDRGTEPLFALANELASFFGGSVAIEDLGRRILAYSSVPGQLIDSLRTRGILARTVPASVFNDDQYRTVLRSEAPIKYPQLDDEMPRAATAIRVGSLPLGSIWAIDAGGDAPLTDEQVSRLEQAAELAAVHMLNDLRVREAGQAPRDDLFRSLLAGTRVSGSEFAELGIAEEHGAALLAFSLGEGGSPVALAQLRSTVHRHFVLRHPEVSAVARRGRVYVLLTNLSPETSVSLAESLLAILDRLIAPGARAAYGGVAHRPSEVESLGRHVDAIFEAAELGSAPPDPGVLTTDRVRPQLLFDRIASAFDDDPDLRDPALQDLSAQQPEFAETLREWCACFGNVARTAQRLNIHENTVRYRLRRALDRVGIDTDDPGRMLATWVQLHVAERASHRRGA